MATVAGESSGTKRKHSLISSLFSDSGGDAKVKGTREGGKGGGGRKQKGRALPLPSFLPSIFMFPADPTISEPGIVYLNPRGRKRFRIKKKRNLKKEVLELALEWIFRF